jgi:hypothetical protein
MPKAHIRLAFRQLIDSTVTALFEQQIFEATWFEFCIQQQSFSKGQDLFTWTAIKETFPKSNPALPFKVSFSIAGLINALDNKIPGLRDTLGDQSIPFAQHHFELIASDAKDALQHQVSITYITPDLPLYEIIGDQLLLSLKPPQTFMLKLQPGLSIVSYQPVTTHSEPCSCPSPKHHPLPGILTATSL